MSSKILHLQITSSKSEYPYETRYPATMALVEFKIKLELVVGIYAQDMKLELRSAEGKFLAELFEDGKTLEELGIKDESVIHVVDTTGNSPSMDAESGQNSARYTLNEDDYANRKDTARKWMQELGVGKTSPSSNEEVPNFIKIGVRCKIQSSASQAPKIGQIAFIGNTHFKPGMWIGVIYDQAVGKNDGSIDGHRYFTCEPNHGGFVVPKAVKPLLDTDSSSVQNNSNLKAATIIPQREEI
uniref:CAP-Gly domain-containing protein n=1 Tax=Ditylenchus dipsaci TaxID=166011 RepID=A0A915CPI7_9BILA